MREYQQTTFQICHTEMQEENFVPKKPGTTQVLFKIPEKLVGI